ncbi:MAG: heme lyase CcmF/NrfE family subunit [Acidobacteria bacterium]|nr:heme lyase CcmF/NrfE family subunit [Acidobacteriota bacterium]
MPEAGYFALLLSLIFTVYAAVAALLGAREERAPFLISAQRSVMAAALALAASAGFLVYLLAVRDFSVEYVASHTSRALPLWYAVAAFWAGQKGSLLFWALLGGLFAAAAVWANRRQHRRLLPYAIAVLMGIQVFFLVLLLVASNPFERLLFPAADGKGLNPLLQNHGMIFHPPALYLGYVGFAIPFAFGIAALITGRLDAAWIRTTRRWTLVAWLFLGAGILLGAQWAYVVLGWGGYWAWDPVENASLLPWLTGTAYLHSVMIQEKKGMLKVWNLVLVILTFALAIFGTFLTRSGVLSSVHSFGQSSLGYAFLWFLAFVLGGSLILLYSRRSQLVSPRKIESLLSRESSFLANNLILVGIAFAVFWGTVFPMVSEAVQGTKVTVGAPFFNRVTRPLGLGLLLLTGICPLIAWRKATATNLKKNFLRPAVVAALAAAAFFALGLREPVPLVFFSAGAFVLTTVFWEFMFGARARRGWTGENFLVALARLVSRNTRRYGGFLIHAGIVAIFVGIVGTSYFNLEKQVTLRKGETAHLGHYLIRFQGLAAERYLDQEVLKARLEVQEGSRSFQSVPEKRFHPNGDQPMTHVAIRSTLREDFYVILAGWESNSGAATFKFLVNPLACWIWYGGWLVLAGGTVALLPNAAPARARVAAPALEEAQHVA